MNLYQAGYCGLGKQGLDAGWQLVGGSEGMSQKAKEGFSGIASSLIELTTLGMPQYAKGIFRHENFFYLIRVNYLAKADDFRRTGYVHCLCFNIRDYYEMVSSPEMITGLASDTFPTEYDDSIKSYPVLNRVSYTSKNVGDILDRYGLSDADYREILLGVLAAIDSKSSPFSIKRAGIDAEQYEIFYDDMLYLIMKGLPYHLRVCMTSFSYKGCNNVFHVSDQLDSDNYFDFDTHESHADYSRLAKFEFTKLYNGSPLIRELDSVWDTIGKQTECLFDNPLKNRLTCEQVEAAFQSTLKKSEAEGIDPRSAKSLLTALLGYELNETKELYNYLADLLALINDNNIRLEDKSIVDQLGKRYERALYPDYQLQLNILNLRNLIEDTDSDKEKKFNMLSEIERTNSERFEYIFGLLKNTSSELAYDYYFERQLPARLKSFEDIAKHIEEITSYTNDSSHLYEKDYYTTLNVLFKLGKKEINKAENFRSVRATEKSVSKLLRDILKKEPEMQKYVIAVGDKINTCIWDRFELDWFNPNETSDYRDCDLNRMVEQNPESKATIILGLCDLCDNTSASNIKEMADDIMKLVFDNKYQLSNSKIKELQSYFISKFFERGTGDPAHSPREFDVLISLLYDVDNRSYPIRQIGTKLMKTSDGGAFESSIVMKNVRNAEILTSSEYKNRFKRDLDDFIEGDSAAELSLKIIKGLKKYKDALEGKELKSDFEIESINLFFISLYRIPLFISAIVAYAIFEYDLWKYSGLSDKKGFYAAIIGLIMLILAGTIGILFKCRIDEGIEYIPDNSGINSGLRIFIYILLLIGLIALLFLAFKVRPLYSLILVCAYNVLAIILMIVSDAYLED